MKYSAWFSFFGVVLYCAVSVFAEDVLRFRGANSQGHYAGTGLRKSWPENGLEPQWLTEDLGAGWGSVVKVGDRLYLNALDPTDTKMESVVCLDLGGKVLWRTAYGRAWTRSYAVARTTPTYIPGDRPKLAVVTGAGDVACLDAGDGKVLWQMPAAETYETRFGLWGMAESPLVADGKILVTLCGKRASAIALDPTDGSVVWEAATFDDAMGYASPIRYENQMIAMTGEFITGIDIHTGQILWQDSYYDSALGGRDDYRKNGPGINCVSPVLKGNRFFVSSGYDQGGVMYEILPEGRGVKVLWRSAVMDIHHGGAVEVEGRIYGSNWRNNAAGDWACLDWETGKTIYDEPWETLGKGVTIFADGMLYIYEEKRGTLGLARPGSRLEVVSSFPITFGAREHWAHPVVCDGILYVRRGGALAAFDIRE